MTNLREYLNSIEEKAGGGDLVSLAVYLTNVAFSRYYIIPENESDKKYHLKMKLVCLEVLNWLLHNYHQNTEDTINFEEIVNRKR